MNKEILVSFFRIKGIIHILMPRGMYAIAGAALVIFYLGHISGRLRPYKKDVIVQIDTVFIEKKISAPALAVTKELPEYTKYKVGEKVCAWNRWSGVIRKIEWSKNDPTILVYLTLQYDEEEGWIENYYYDSELSLGECN
jgi:hypothetical protein